MAIKVVSDPGEVRDQVKKWRAEGLSVGLVPTMGYLHEGHQSLIQKSVEQNDKTVVRNAIKKWKQMFALFVHALKEKLFLQFL